MGLNERNGKHVFESYEALGLNTEDARFPVRTRSGGLQLHSNRNRAAGLAISQDEPGLGPGIGTRGENGFIVAPGGRTVFGDCTTVRGDLAELRPGALFGGLARGVAPGVAQGPVGQ